MVAQVVMLRTFLSVFSGLELVIGIILSNWMLLTALGAFLGRHLKIRGMNLTMVFLAHILLGALPLAMNFAILVLKSEIVPPGVLINPFQIYISSFVLLLPFCLVSGFLFTAFSTDYSSLKNSNEIYRIYGIEALGAIAGGLTFNFVLVFLFGSFLILKLLLLINLLIALFLYLPGFGKRSSWILGLCSIAGAGIITMLDIEQYAYQKYFRNHDILDRTETRYGNIAVTENDGQVNFYENGVVVFSSDNVIKNEENVHYAMLQHPDPEHVLVISGGVSDIVKEVAKYDPVSIDYVELDRGFVEMASRYLQSARLDLDVRIINQDPRLYIKESQKKYDIVLCNLPDPINSQINRYYTLEFFEELKDALHRSGVISTSLEGFANYMSPESKEVHSALYSTMRLVFENVMIIPGQRNYFIASDMPLSPRIANLSFLKGLNNKYVNHYYLDDQLIVSRKNQIEEEIGLSSIINYDFQPSIYLSQLKLWLTKFKVGTGVFVIGFLFLSIFLVRLNAVNHGLFVTGFSATSLEMLLIVSFQAIHGYVYFMMGIFISFFMAGLMAGSIYLIRFVNINYRNFSGFQYLIGIMAVLIPLIILQIKHLNSSHLMIHIFFSLFLIIIGLLTGVQFALGTKLRTEGIARIASGTYGADSLGSSIGALLTVALLVPMFGFIKVCLIIGILNFLTGLYILTRMKTRGTKS